MLKDLNIKKLNQKGFSLLEVMIAITIITAGILGVFSLITKVSTGVAVSNNEVIASNLAQEGIEVVRNRRDTNWLELNAFDQNIPFSDSVPIFTGPGPNRNNNPSDVDVWEMNNIGVGNGWKRQVYYDTIDQFYGQAKFQKGTGNFPDNVNWEITPFIRWIEVNSISADQIQIISYVEWTERGQSRIIGVEDCLYDWK